ncbi:hypothetical protein ABIB40_001680 [Pedobacter sp. UYP30]|uniref:WG repeat-containing protein n=1 Tax=Pedobacter sp. UYP30 TaxID=1756400 RepID=UPI003394D2FA
MKKPNINFKRCSIILFVLITPLTLFAQQVTYLIAPGSAYSSISNFSDGLARVEINFKNTGFINPVGKLVFRDTVEDAGNFNCGRAWVRKTVNGDTKFGFVDKKGQLVIPCVYDEVEDFSCNRSAVNKDGVWQIINQNGKKIITDSLLITETEVTDLAAKTSRWEDTEPPAFRDNRMLTRNNDKFGFTDLNGKIVIPRKLLFARDFSDGMAVVSTQVKKYPDMKGNDELSKLYNKLPDGPEDYIWSVVDTTGKVLFSLDADQLEDFHDGMAIFYKDENFGVINKQGTIVFDAKFYNKPYIFSDGISCVQIDGLTDTNKDGYLLTLNKTGEVIAKIPLAPARGCVYDSKLAFHEGLLAVKIDALWGYMDKMGELIIKPQFEEATSFSEGFAVVTTSDGKIALIKNPLKLEVSAQPTAKKRANKYEGSFGLKNNLMDVKLFFGTNHHFIVSVKIIDQNYEEGSFKVINDTAYLTSAPNLDEIKLSGTEDKSIAKNKLKLIFKGFKSSTIKYKMGKNYADAGDFLTFRNSEKINDTTFICNTKKADSLWISTKSKRGDEVVLAYTFDNPLTEKYNELLIVPDKTNTLGMMVNYPMYVDENGSLYAGRKKGIRHENMHYLPNQKANAIPDLVSTPPMMNEFENKIFYDVERVKAFLLNEPNNQ